MLIQEGTKASMDDMCNFLSARCQVGNTPTARLSTGATGDELVGWIPHSSTCRGESAEGDVLRMADQLQDMKDQLAFGTAMMSFFIALDGSKPESTLRIGVSRR